MVTTFLGQRYRELEEKRNKLIISWVIRDLIEAFNNYISRNLFYSVKPVVFNPYIILYITLVVFIVVSISSVIPLIKILILMTIL